MKISEHFFQVAYFYLSKSALIVLIQEERERGGGGRERERKGQKERAEINFYIAL